MPNSTDGPFEDQDLSLRIIQRAVALIMLEVSSIDDILDDRKQGRLIESIVNFLNRAGIEAGQLLPAEIADAYSSGYEFGGALLQDAGLTEIGINLTTQVHVQAVQALAIAAVTDMEAAIRTAATMFIEDITGILENVQIEIGAGMLRGDATREITKRVQAELLKNGLTGFITKNGRRLPLDFYAMTVTRTKTREAATQGAVNRYIENDCDLIRFPIRSHTCHICGARERLVISLSGETAGYPTPEDIGGLPPFHPNCRHYPIPVTNPEDYPPQPFTGRDMRNEASKDTYKNEQAIRRKANEEKKLYMKMKAEADAAGESFPTIGVWRRMKRKNDAKWKALQAAYKESISRIPVINQR